MRNSCNILAGEPEGKGHLREVDVDDKSILNGFISSYGVWDWIGLALLSGSNERTLFIVPCKVNHLFYTRSRIIIFCIEAVYMYRALLFRLKLYSPICLVQQK